MGRPESKSVLVTGGTGLVGSHLVELLIRKGLAVKCLVRDPKRLRWLNDKNVELVQGDCSDPASLAYAVKKVSAVYHVAGLTKAKRPREFYDVNHIGTKNILDACAMHNSAIRKFILVSSLSAAGPSPDGRPVRDIDAPRPVSDYGKSKLLAEDEALRRKDLFPVVILRPSAVYGPRDTDIFELFKWASMGLMLDIAGVERYISPCYVEDLANATALAAEKETKSGSIYFVAENRAYSWTEFREALFDAGGVRARVIKLPVAAAYIAGLVYEAAGRLTGRPAVVSRQKIREAAQRYWLCDLKKIENDLGFRAEYPLKRGLETTWKWYRDNGWIK